MDSSKLSSALESLKKAGISVYKTNNQVRPVLTRLSR